MFSWSLLFLLCHKPQAIMNSFSRSRLLNLHNQQIVEIHMRGEGKFSTKISHRDKRKEHGGYPQWIYTQKNTSGINLHLLPKQILQTWQPLFTSPQSEKSNLIRDSHLPYCFPLQPLSSVKGAISLQHRVTVLDQRIGTHNTKNSISFFTPNPSI